MTIDATQTDAQKPPACPYCSKPIETAAKAKIFDIAYDHVRRKRYSRTREMSFCCTTCASNYQMSCEG